MLQAPIPVLLQAPVRLRHAKLAAAGTAVVGATLAAQDVSGINGERGYQSGTYEPALSEEGTAKVTLPNAAGGDGVLHRRRFRCLTDGGYQPGDEWIEVWEGAPGRGRALFCGTPVDWKVGRSSVDLTLADGTALLPQQRENAAGFWSHAPRDVFEHYTKAWRTVVADDFVGGALIGTRWFYDATSSPGATATNQPNAVRLTVGAINTTSYFQTLGGYWPGVNMSTSRAWRAECKFSIQNLTGTVSIAFTFGWGGGSPAYATIQYWSDTGSIEAILSNTSPAVTIDKVIALPVTDVTLAVERHDRWVFFYANGTLVWAGEATGWQNSLNANFGQPSVAVIAGSPAGGYVDLDYIVARDLQPYLMRGTDKGDYRLPAAPPPGGLRGSYYDEADLRPVGDTTGNFYARVLSPTRAPYARRQDATINFAAASPPTWQPAGPAGGLYFTARWTGAIYLDLANVDVNLRLTSLDNGARLYVGKTTFGQELLAQWANPTGAPYTLTSASLRTHLGASLSGWYPVRLEYVQGVGSGGIVLQQSLDGGAYAVVPSTSLSPFGIYEAEVRYDSHSEQLRTLVETFALQYRCEPRSLESGLFPGEVVPRVRVGRDTDKVLEPPESTDVEVSGSARDVASALLADAAGLADQANAAQLTAEALNFLALWPAAAEDRHLAIASGYESLSEITDPNLLRTRLAAMLTLRSAPWEEVGARPRGARELRDTYPPSVPFLGSLASFDWEPGDGVRIVDDGLDINDSSPRQIVAPSWPFAPGGRGSPTVRFRQRPRSQQDALRQLIRAVLLPQRNYQGQLVVVNGSLGSAPASAAVPDIYSRTSLPSDLSTVVAATLVIQYKGDTSAGTITINGASTPLTAQVPGRYDVTPYVARPATGEQRMYAGLTGHTSVAELMLELLVRT